MNIILHIPLLISHVFMYQASGYIIIYIAGDCTKKTSQQPPRKSKHISAKRKQNADFSPMNHCHGKIFTVYDYSGFFC